MAYVQMRGICKRFGSVYANVNASFSLERGEIAALLGENGSGKSTLVNMLAGLYAPDSGSISIDGKGRRFVSPKDAIKAGVGMVHQHFMLIQVMSALENIILGERTASPLVRRKQKAAAVNKLMDEFSLRVDLDKKIYRMPVSERQTVEILKMLYQGAQTLILDEPTAVLTPQETGRFFDVLRSMKQAGKAIVIITHKLGEVMELRDRVTVLRKGEIAGVLRTADTNAGELAGLMVGGSVNLEIGRKEPQRSPPALVVRGLRYYNDAGDKVPVLDGVSFEVAQGEILGLAGIAGSGQKELCEILAGLRKAAGGSALFMNEELLGLSSRAIKKKGVSMSFIPEDRLGIGLAPGMDIVDNMMIKSYDLGPGIFVDRARGREQAETVVRDYGISTPSVHHKVQKLSGGNIQKVLFGREIAVKPRLLITAYPARGLDIGSSYKIYDILNREKQRGTAILFIGEDLDVIRELCDRALVVARGKVMAAVNPRALSKEEMGALMMGG
jgi:simple sugar transport system ATP-binding protein